MTATLTQNASQALQIYYDPIEKNPLLSKKLVVLGFGSQGYGQSVNLKDAGANVRIALREESATKQKAEQAGFETIRLEEAVEWADVIVFLVPDTKHREIYEQYFEGKMRPGQALVFSHGFSIHYGEITPPADVDVFLVAPKGPGHLVRSEWLIAHSNRR